TIRSRPPTWSRWRCCGRPDWRPPRSMPSPMPTRAVCSRGCADLMAVSSKHGWVGRSIRRVEEPTLGIGDSRVTGDLPAARHVRFVRSSGAAGRIVRIAATEGATIFPATELAAIKPIRPMLHKFNYVPIAQPVLATEVVRFVGEPVAAVVAASAEEAEDIADRVEVEVDETPAGVGTAAALPAHPPRVHAGAAGHRVVLGRS